MEVSSILNEGRLAIRRALHHPWIALFKAIVLGIGIAAASSIFSVYFAFMHQALPFEDAENLMFIGQSQEGRTGHRIRHTTYHSYEAVRDDNQTLEAIGYANWTEKELRFDDVQEFLEGVQTSGNYLEVLGSRPFMGNIYTEASWQDKTLPPVLLSHKLWIEIFNSAPDVVGKPVQLNSRLYEVAGVLEPQFLVPGLRNFWRDMFFIHPITRSEIPVESMKSRWFPSVGRLKAGMTLEDLNVDLQPISQRVIDTWPKVMVGKQIEALSLRERLTGGYQNTLNLLIGSGVFVLLVAMINLVVISFGEANSHLRSEAIRQYYGAQGHHKLAATVFENMPNALLGGLIGLGLGDVLLRWLASDYPDIPVDLTAGFGLRIGVALGFAVVVAIVASALYSLYSRVNASSLNRQAFRQGTKVVSSRLSFTLILTELIVSAVALIVVGLFGASADKRYNVERKVDIDHTYAVQITPDRKTVPEHEDRLVFFKAMLEEFKQIPGIRSAAVAGTIAPFQGNLYPFIEQGSGVTLEESDKGLYRRSVSTGYFDTLGLQIMSGRDFTVQDMELDAERTLVINQALADQYWPGEDPIGKYIKISHRSDVRNWARIIGIVENQMSSDLNPAYIPFAYRPISTYLFPSANILFTMDSPETPLDQDAIADTIRRVGPGSIFYDAWTVRQFIDYWSADTRNLTQLVLTFAAIVVGLSATGVMAFYFQNIVQRSPEFSLKMVLGATPGRIRRSIAKNALVATVFSFVMASPIAYLLASAMNENLYQTPPHDPQIFSLALGALGVIVILSITGPLIALIRERRTLL